MTSFGDIQPFLQENSDLAPHLCPKLLNILTNQHSQGCLLIELAATVDYGEVFAKATYRLEGDGPLALTCYEEVEKVSFTIRMENIPNVRAIATKLSGKPPTDPLHEQWVTYAHNCVHPGLNYFQTQLTTSLKNSMEVFKTCRLCSPSKVCSMQPDAATLHDALQCLPFLGASEVSALTAELPTYLSKAAGVSDSFDLLEWWKQNSSALPCWSFLTKRVLLQPSSATSERVFSLLKATFGDQQGQTLQDYVEASLMMQFNKR